MADDSSPFFQDPCALLLLDFDPNEPLVHMQKKDGIIIIS